MAPNCTKCKYYFITYDQNTPRGCKAYQIQSKQLPSVIVKNANNGADCIGFEEKSHKKKEINLNDSRYW